MSLSNLHILVTRPEPQGHELCALLKKQGATTYYIPTLEIKPRAVNLNFFIPDIAIFLSANAVKYYPYQTFPASIKYFSVGVATAIALMERGVIAEQPNKSDSEGLLALSDLQKVRNKKIAIFCGKDGRMLLQETLKNRGAHCVRYEVYERCCALYEANNLQNLLTTVQLDYAICTSGENLLCLEKLAGAAITQLYDLPVIVISKRIATIAVARGFKQVLVINHFIDNASIVQQLVKWRETL